MQQRRKIMNNKLIFSDHAIIQAQRRGVDSAVVNYAVEFGKRMHAGGGLLRCFFDKRARSRLRNVIPRQVYAQIEKKLDCFVILSEDESIIITVGHQYQKVWCR